MRRSIIALVGAGGELVRFFGLAALARAFLGSASGKSPLAFYQYAASPHLLFALGFFFLWRDPKRYAAYRPLLAAGKALCVLTLASLAVRFVQSFRQDVFLGGDPGIMLTAMAAFFVWDLAAGLALVHSLRKYPEVPGNPESQPSVPAPEPVELE